MLLLFPAWLLYGGIMALYWTYQYLNRPKPPTPESRLVEFAGNLPKTDEGTPMPMIFGRCLVERPLLVWHGAPVAKLENMRYRYGLNMLFVAGMPMTPNPTGGFNAANLPILHRVFVDRKPVQGTGGGPLYGQPTGAYPNGGTSGGPKIFAHTIGPLNTMIGQIEFFNGHPDQALSSTQAIGSGGMSRAFAFLGWEGENTARTPGYRDQCVIALTADGSKWSTPKIPGQHGGFDDAFCVGDSPNLAQFGFEISSYGQNVFGNFQSFNGDADPMEVLYDIVTNDWGKVAFPTTQIDTVSWQACSDALKAEQHGYSRCHYESEDAKRVVGDILGQLGGVLFHEATTNKLVTKLIRPDYSIGSLPAFSPSTGILRAESFQHGTWQNTTNGVNLTFVDRGSDYATRMVPARDSGNAAGQANRNRPIEISYPGISNPVLAAKVAMRELAVVSQPLSKGRIVFDRRASALRPGDAFLITDWDELGIVSLVVRVVNIDLGDLHNPEVIIDIIQDQWSANLATQTVEEVEPEHSYAAPLSSRLVTEAPRFLQWLTFLESNINDPDVQRIWGLARPDNILDTPSAQSYRVDTKKLNNFTGPLDNGWLDEAPIYDFATGETVYLHNTDVARQPFPTRGLVHTALPKSALPGPTTVGLKLKNLGSDIFDDMATGNADYLFPPPPSNLSVSNAIRTRGWNLIVVGDKTHHELIAFESVTDHGDGTYTLNSLWREMADTVAREWPVNTPVYLVRARSTGHRPWALDTALLAFTRAQSFYRDDSGGSGIEDACDGMTIVGRASAPLRPQNFRVISPYQRLWSGPNDPGRDVVGTKGEPAPSDDYYTEVTHLDGELLLYAQRRNRQVGALTRGDDVDEANSDGNISYNVEARKVLIDGSEEDAFLISALGDVAFDNVNNWAALGGAGHGVINLYLRSTRTAVAGETGLPVGTIVDSWQTANVKVTAPRWRNLLVNGRFVNGMSGWTQTQGTTQTGNGSISLRGDLSGYYMFGVAPGLVPIARQEIIIAGYKPGRLTARFIFYAYNKLADAGDTVTITLESLNQAGTVLDTVSGSASFSTTYYSRSAFTITTLNASTYKLRVTIQFNAVGDVDNNIDTILAETMLLVGQSTNGVLSNESFDTGATTGWTVNTGAFVVNAMGGVGPSSHFLQGGANASNEIQQDYTIAAGYEFGTAVLRFWRKQTLTGDWATIKLRALDVSNNVLVEEVINQNALPTLNRWYPQRMAIDLPATGLATKLRVIFETNRTAGSGDSGACADDFFLEIHKHLDPSVALDANFSEPSVQLLPTTWQSFHLCHPTLPLAEVIDGESLSVSDQPATDLIWSDGGSHASVPVTGQFGGGKSSALAYPFTRQSGAGALHLKSINSAAFTGRVGRALSTRKNGFTIIVFLRVNERSFSTACGIVGRMTPTLGWGLSIDASGFARARMRGDAGSKTATRTGATVVDGALHMVAITWDPIADELHVDDDRGRTTTSTATGLGEFHAPDAVLRVGRDDEALDTLPGDILRVYAFKRPLTQAQIAGVWNYGKDPSGLLATYVRAVPTWCQGLPNADGATLAIMASDQIAIGHAGYIDPISGLGAERQGLVLSRAVANRVPSFDLFGASWTLNASAARSLIADASGRMLGAEITGVNGIKLIGITLSATVTVKIIFYIKAASGSDVVRCDLRNASDTLLETVIATSAPTAGKWMRVSATFALWDASTTTGRITIRSTGTFGLTHAMLIYQDTTIGEPALWHRDALGTIAADVTASMSPSGLTAQLNTEGEILVEGIGLEAAPPSCGVLQLRNTTNNQNRRDIQCVGGAARLVHYDATPASNNSTSTAFAWNTGFEIRGRWRRIGTCDAANAFAGVRVANASVNSSSYGRSSTWTPSTTLTNAIELGVGASVTAWNGLISRVRVTFCEEKI